MLVMVERNMHFIKNRKKMLGFNAKHLIEYEKGWGRTKNPSLSLFFRTFILADLTL
jgi:hypothetical protein